MRPSLVVLAVALCSIALAGCEACGIAPAPTSFAIAQPCASPVADTAAPCAQSVQIVPTAVQAVQTTTGGSYARAVAGIPGNVVTCIGNGLRCAIEALFPIPQPETRWIPVGAAATAAYAAPCAATHFAVATQCEPAIQQTACEPEVEYEYRTEEFKVPKTVVIEEKRTRTVRRAIQTQRVVGPYVECAPPAQVERFSDCVPPSGASVQSAPVPPPAPAPAPEKD